jgi:hypothetical protein
VKIATKDFDYNIDGERGEAVAGQTRVYDDRHPVVTKYPDCWRSATAAEERGFRAEDLKEELKVRKDRVAELARPRPAGKAVSAAGRRQAEEAEFWARMDRLYGPDEHVDREQAAFDAGQHVIEQIDADRMRQANDDILEAWQGRLDR